jgi:L-asparaginase
MPTFKPALILHGGAGNIRRATLPPELYTKYHASLTICLRAARDMLHNGSTALDAAVHAVSLMEDDELFNCGRGSVFTSAGTIEMEASVMVTSLSASGQTSTTTPNPNQDGEPKRGAGVMGLKNVRNPIALAREVLLRTPYDSHGNPRSGDGCMHSQLVGPYVEQLAREQNWDVQFMPDEWFWTKRRWDEHRRGLGGTGQELFGGDDDDESDGDMTQEMAQGTVGCVCLDQWGNLAVATSTGGMTNKWPGRIGDTPTLGAGFWAEDWATESDCAADCQDEGEAPASSFVSDIRSQLGDWLPPFLRSSGGYTPLSRGPSQSEYLLKTQQQPPMAYQPPSPRRRAAAVSGTGNGDSFLRVAAARTACAMLRFRPMPSLAEAVSAVAGPDGELQRSAGRRWGKTGEGEGGMIGIEAEVDAEEDGSMDGVKERRGKAVFDFNCSGMWRAWMEQDAYGRERERVMVFRDEYH